MNRVITTALTFTLLTGCAISPYEERRAAIIDCTKEFMEYDAAIGEASSACMQIYSRPVASKVSAGSI
jgi:hypothetical protein